MQTGGTILRRLGASRNRQMRRRASTVSYGYLNLTVNDKIMPYVDELKKNIIYVSSYKDCKAYVQEIQKSVQDGKLNCIGLDVEGYKIGRNGTVSLVQICAQDVYLFDVYKCDNTFLFIKCLKELLEDGRIVKITHDCREDCSILFNQYSISLNNIFDTQVAYNLLSKETKKDLYQISYDDLLYKCLLLHNKHKIYFHKMISLDQKIYLKRPIGKELIHYAIQDVIYLKPLMLNLVDRLLRVCKDGEARSESFGEDDSPSIENSDDVIGEEAYSNLTEHKNNLIKRITKLSERYINYQFLNTHVKNEKELQKGMILDGMIVSCNNLNLYVKLNLSRTGVITNCLRNEFEIGDMVKCVILGFCNNDYIKLGLCDPSQCVVTREVGH
ncbi:3'-5' exonuclease, putative [Plasmodium knowlesi strain H]|uniref:3'-5' exonuclease, putative n=3 Tax=Plasmodium knowlesi TaxID=5850 RepID=A0A5K1VPD1_PLAKH|nr:3'-5' exonuclease, putative [Plasmodium knowlesi strain H]OTN66699.1 putative 3'-5' exonuclease [Plasmodium knowlesi]CAA9986801.1 3'-5' exonuclease, putative [Plasmodium knowlesi strain H]SBO23649.1 3'-5' exonuclease, putative [Plasmodium knowlesi strain H]SBO25219.1 3'-5' exonuclease, putative [Plasmodium knowlesi strain H]VVS76275.1 3'-5' exonuclease, putative [Plasmodium knowlesi strain H]|eukprot:XP_002257985.1 3'-5' exonuclease, putative [Plasmodium knowlesi strain H]